MSYEHDPEYRDPWEGLTDEQAASKLANVLRGFRKESPTTDYERGNWAYCQDVRVRKIVGDAMNELEVYGMGGCPLCCS